VTRLGADATGTTIAELKALGVTFVSRYVSDFPAKNLTLAEARRISAAGIDLVTNWENDVNDWRGGYPQGVAYAKKALAQHAACGGPTANAASWGVYPSVDMQVDPADPRLHRYFQGFNAVLGVAHTGAYAQTSVLRELRSLRLIGCGERGGTWRSMSTFGQPEGLGLPGEFDVEQTGQFNANYDRNIANSARFGQWRIGAAPIPVPPPVPGGPVYLISVSPDPTQGGVKGTTGIFAVHEGLGPVHVDGPTYTADFQKNHGPITVVSPAYYAALVAAVPRAAVVLVDAAAAALIGDAIAAKVKLPSAIELVGTLK
jgi:hypothetical protein